MKDLQKIGGIAALCEAVIYITAFVLYFGVLDSSGHESPVQQVAFLSETQTMQHVAMLMIGAAFSSILVILVLSLHHLLKAVAPNVMQVASVFGFLWAGLVIAGSMIFNVGMATVIDLYGKDPEQAATVWLTISTIYEGLAGGNELVGGFWVFLVSWVGIRHQVFPKSLHMLGILVGVAGISSSLPGLGEIGGAVFGLGQIGWFLYLGGVMIRAGKASAK